MADLNDLDLPNRIVFGSDAAPGIRRSGRHPRFRYIDERTGRPPADDDRGRIASLAVPPAWTDVWIAPSAWWHLQATGRDAKGRKQYRYHADFTAATAAKKFADLVGFGTNLGRLRRRVTRDLSTADLDHRQLVAVIVRLLDVTSLRVGNEEYARVNDSYGLTTLRSKHVRVKGSTLRMAFSGKSNHRFDVTVESKALARIVRKCQDLPGQLLFQYVTDDGQTRTVGSGDVNEYLGEICGEGTTAKTFRTWNATSLAAAHLVAAASEGEDATTRTVNRVVDLVADELGNTRAVCRTSYVHPNVVEGFLDGSLMRSWQRPVPQRPSGLSADERRTLRYLKR